MLAAYIEQHQGQHPAECVSRSACWIAQPAALHADRPIQSGNKSARSRKSQDLDEFENDREYHLYARRSPSPPQRKSRAYRVSKSEAKSPEHVSDEPVRPESGLAAVLLNVALNALAAANNTPDASESEELVSEDADNLVEFICLPHPTEVGLGALEQKYITTSADARACHISKYLWSFLTPAVQRMRCAMSLGDAEFSSGQFNLLSGEVAFRLFITAMPGHFQQLDPMVSLRAVCMALNRTLTSSQTTLPVIYFARHNLVL